MGKVRYRKDIKRADKLLCVQEFDTIKLYRQKKETKRKNVQTQHSTVCKSTYIYGAIVYCYCIRSTVIYFTEVQNDLGPL